MQTGPLTTTIDTKLADARARLAQLETDFQQASFDVEARGADPRRRDDLALQRVLVADEVAQLEAARPVAVLEDDQARQAAHEKAVALLRENLEMEAEADARLDRELAAAWETFRAFAIRRSAQSQRFMAAAKALTAATGMDHTHAANTAQRNRGMGATDYEQLMARFRWDVVHEANKLLASEGQGVMRGWTEVGAEGPIPVDVDAAVRTALETAVGR